MSRLVALLFYISLLFTVSCQQQDNYQSRAEEVFPAVPMKYAALFRVDNLPVSITFFSDQWTLVIFGEADCKANCLERLALVNEVKSAKKLFVIDGLPGHDRLRELGQSFPGVAITMGTSAASFDNFYKQFDVDTVESAQKQSHIYIINSSAELVYTLVADDLSSADIDREINFLNSH